MCKELCCLFLYIYEAVGFIQFFKLCRGLFPSCLCHALVDIKIEFFKTVLNKVLDPLDSAEKKSEEKKVFLRKISLESITNISYTYRLHFRSVN